MLRRVRVIFRRIPVMLRRVRVIFRHMLVMLRRVRVVFRRIPVMLHHTPVWPCCERLNRRTSGPAATMRALSVGSQL
jgi:hypothetical protein